MSAADLVLVGGGLLAIVAIYWWFFIAGRTPVAVAAGAGGVQEQVIVVAGGYEPGTVSVRAGRPVRLIFDRKETNPCSEEIVLGEFGIRKFLAPHARTTVEFTPTTAGSFDFTCGMGMLHGRLVVTNE